MSPQKTEQYRAYFKASGTVAKTRQVVMLYDGIIRYLKQAAEAIHEKRFQDRYNLTIKTTEIIAGLQSSIDFENGGKIADVLHGFYTNMFRRIVGLNFIKDPAEGERLCNAVIEEMKQMRQAWDTIDHSLGSSASSGNQTDTPPPGKPNADPLVISA